MSGRNALWLGAALLWLAAPAPARAGNCQSAAKVAADLWKEWGDEAMLVGCAAAAVEGVPFGVCLKTAHLYEKVVVGSIRFWNVAAQNSWATLGPRRLEPGHPEEGTLVSTGGRLFLTSVPLDVDQIELSVTRLDGKAGATATLCAFPAEGRPRELGELTFDKKGEEGTLKLRARGVFGQILGVHLDAKSVVKKFQYRVALNRQPEP